jgi:5-methylcytosine-specific restriction endonuclease McrA
MNQSTLDDYRSTGVECEVCGRVFDTEAGRNRHKGAKHGSTKVDVECEYCGDTVTVFPSQEDRTRFCDGGCKEKWESDNWQNDNAPAWDGKTLELECDWCGDRIIRFESDIEGAEHVFCSRQCCGSWQKTQVGPKNPLWRGGKALSDTLRSTLGRWNDARETALTDECEWCGSESSGTGKSHDVHHIIPLNAGGVNHEDNLMCLCRECHAKAEAFTRRIPEIQAIPEMIKSDD